MSNPLGGKLIDEILPRLESMSSQGDLVARIVSVVAQEIIDGTLPPHHELTSVELSRRFMTSRTPIREALAVLQREGLVDIRTRHRPRVATMSRKDVRDVYRTRAALYELVSEEIVRNCADEEIRRLEIPLERMGRAAEEGDLDEFFASSVTFRYVESEICANPVVGRVIESLGLRVYRFRRYGMSLPNRMSESLADHRRLYIAYLDRDERVARALTASLVHRALAAIERTLLASGQAEAEDDEDLSAPAADSSSVTETTTDRRITDA